jgi:multimeric flavodoxin WrbA
VRKGQGSVDLDHAEFIKRAKAVFDAPAFDSHQKEVDLVTELLFQEYDQSRKSPRTAPAGAEFQKPAQELAIDWLQAHEALKVAQKEHDSNLTDPTILLINGSPRSDNTCPGELSKTHRLCERAINIFKNEENSKEPMKVEYLDLSRVTSEYGKTIHPCKGCVSTAMPLCHWPCSCYPNHALGQTHDWMNEIYPMWMRAHGVMIITPVHWYSPPSVLKLMMDRMVCADGGNPDPTSTDGKEPKLAKKLELRGWDYPRHLKGRNFSVIAHGDTEGVMNVKQAIVSWLNDMGLVSAGSQAELDRMIGYYRPYATSHDDLDQDRDLFLEVENAAHLLRHSVLQSMEKPSHLAETTVETTVRNK